jgi:hypothetical protein
VDKIQWFLAHPLYRSLGLFELTPSKWLVALVVTVAAGGMGLWLSLRVSRPLIFILIALALIPLTFLPNLVVAENNSFVFRTGVALTSLITLYFCLGALGIWLLIRHWLKPRLTGRDLASLEHTALGVAAALVGAAAFVAARNVTTLIVDPQNTELRLIRSDVAALPTGVGRVGFVQIAWNQGLTQWYSDEIGLASSARPWVPEPAVFLILREEGRLPAGAAEPAVDLLPWDATALPKNEPVIDLRRLQDYR